MTSARGPTRRGPVRKMVCCGCAVYCLRAATRFAGRDFGACTRIRTRDQLIKSQLLYQLSYAGAPVIVFAKSSSACCRGHRRPPALLSKLLSNPKTVVKLQGVERGQIAGEIEAAYYDERPPRSAGGFQIKRSLGNPGRFKLLSNL